MAGPLPALLGKFQEAQARPHIDRLETLIVIDDAQRFVGNPSPWPQAIAVTTPLSHILAVLRSSGCGLCVSTQLPASVDPGVLALSNLLLVVGGIHGKEQQDVLAHSMGMNQDQRAALGKLVRREAVGFYARGTYCGCVHGWVPHVSN